MRKGEWGRKYGYQSREYGILWGVGLRVLLLDVLPNVEGPAGDSEIFIGSGGLNALCWGFVAIPFCFPSP